jgi:predicted transcriptional regulator
MSMDAPDPDCLFAAVHAFLQECRCGAEMRACRAYWQTHCHISAEEMRLLAALIEEPLCAHACARRLGRDTESAREFLDALVSVGLLDRRDEGYTASPATALYYSAFVNDEFSSSDDQTS